MLKRKFDSDDETIYKKIRNETIILKDLIESTQESLGKDVNSSEANENIKIIIDRIVNSDISKPELTIQQLFVVFSLLKQIKNASLTKLLLMSYLFKKFYFYTKSQADIDQIVNELVEICNLYSYDNHQSSELFCFFMRPIMPENIYITCRLTSSLHASGQITTSFEALKAGILPLLDSLNEFGSSEKTLRYLALKGFNFSHILLKIFDTLILFKNNGNEKWSLIKENLLKLVQKSDFNWINFNFILYKVYFSKLKSFTDYCGVTHRNR